MFLVGTSLRACKSSIGRNMPSNGFGNYSITLSKRISYPTPGLLKTQKSMFQKNLGIFRGGKLFSSSSKTTLKPNLTADKPMGYWLLGVSAAVFGMIVLGGVTRLTRSGLSMVDWKLEGRRLPSSKEAWDLEFEKYKLYPEYKRRNMKMTLEEFKQIYFLEWFHRMWGRALGVVYGVPVLYFLATRKSSSTRLKLLGLLSLGGAQGLVGWWMVKSGLDEATMSKWQDPRVSAYRLAAHLFTAMVLYSGLLWMGLSSLIPNKINLSPEEISFQKLRQISGLKRNAGLLLALVGTTFMSGAFVAGNDAGCAYNDWPLFAGRIVPDEVEDFFGNLINGAKEKGKEFLGDHPDFSYHALFENTGVVQFNHRTLAYCTFASSLLAFAATRRFSRLTLKNNLLQTFQRNVGFAGHVVVGIASLQVLLGITTLMLVVPVHLASTHQAGAISLWTAALYLNHVLRYIKYR